MQINKYILELQLIVYHPIQLPKPALTLIAVPNLDTSGAEEILLDQRPFKASLYYWIGGLSETPPLDY